MPTATISIDKSSWGKGPWQNEPDGVRWIDETTGLHCMALRSEETGAWRGYVGVPAAHPAYGRTPEQLHALYDIIVHGGLTTALAGNTPDSWLLGFCCCHLYDQRPAYQPMHDFFKPSVELTVPATYRDLEYVRQECCELARQLSLLAPAQA